MKYLKNRASQPKGRPKRKRPYLVRNVLGGILGFVALCILFYPIVANYVVAQKDREVIQKYEKRLGNLPLQKEHQLLQDARKYNQYLFYKSQGFAYPFAIPNYDKELVTGKDGIIGTLSIPQISITDIPIHHGDSEKVLLTGVGHIPQTSLPIGGRNTHAVLPAHSGRLNNTLFSSLDKLHKGDVFYIKVLDLELKYEVNRIDVVWPDDVKELNIVKDEDLVTLVTCYPTGINNQRLLVTGKRVPLNLKLHNETIRRDQYGYNFWVMLGSSILALLALLIALWVILQGRRPLYQVAARVIKQPQLSDAQEKGDFGPGFYLTDRKKVALAQAEKLFPAGGAVINLYRLKQRKRLTRWIFKSKTENWRAYLADAKRPDFADPKHELLAGPFPSEEKLVKHALQYCLKSEQALRQLKYLKTLDLDKSKKESAKKVTTKVPHNERKKGG